MAQATGLRIVVVGSHAERDLVEQVRERIDGASIPLIGPSLGELGALISEASLVLCNNSGPAHIAAALDRPLVVMYALTNSQHTPWCATSRVLYRDVPCRDCLKSVCPMGHHECLLGIAAQQVAQAALSLIDRRVAA